MTDRKPLVVGTRSSRLALWQAEAVAARLGAAGFETELRTFVTSGDIRLDKPLPELGDKGLFTAELDAALLDGSIDLAVHSLKDLPTVLPDGLALSAVPERASPWDALVATDPAVRVPSDLPQGAVVGTSSLRRAAQLRRWRPDLQVVSVRGNVETRIRKAFENGWGGTVLAEAGLRRLGLEAHITARFDADVMLPGIAQGALGVVTAVAEAERLAAALGALDDPAVHREVLAERALLRRLEGGCQVPVGGLAERLPDGLLRLHGIVASLDGTEAVRDLLEGEDPEALGLALAELLLSAGADRILAAIRGDGA